MLRIFNIKSLFLLNGVVELLGGIVLLLYPKLLLIGANNTSESLASAKMYVLAIFVIGVVSYQCFKHYDKSNRMFRMIFLSFIGYHLLLSFQLYGYYNIGIIDHLGPFILHLCLGVLFTTIFLIEKEED